MRELSDLLAGRAVSLRLDEAALMLATIEFPRLDPAPSLRILDAHAEELDARLRSGASFVTTANGYLFDELGFSGAAAENYYDPANSCLNEVLRRKTGIPITLSVVYLEIARRLGQPVFGIGFPRHFLVQYDDGLSSTYIDVFHGGRLLTAADCYGMAGSAPDPSLLARANLRQILARMVNNLRGIYISRQAYKKALRTLDLWLEAFPDSADDFKQRALIHFQLDQMRAARVDFERYLELEPKAADREEIEKQLAALRRWLVGMN